jgi:hypothetical protein
MTTIKPDLTMARTSAHRDATSVLWRTVVSTLIENLGVGLVALAAGVTADTVTRWASGEATNPREANERRLRETYRVYRELVAVDAPHTVRAWFMGSNPQLNDDAPVEAIAADRFKETLAAARSFRDIG